MLFGTTFYNDANAVDTVDIKNNDGNTIFQLKYYGTTDGTWYHPNVPVISTSDLDTIQKNTLEKAMTYWVERVRPVGTVAEPIVINVGTFDQTTAPALGINAMNAFCGSFLPFPQSGVDNKRITPMEIVFVDGATYNSLLPHAVIGLGIMPWGYDPNTQLPESKWNPPVSALTSMESTMIHEVGHGLGITDGERWKELCNIIPGLFLGNTALDVYNDQGTITRGIPLNYESDWDVGHFDIFKGLMTHQSYRNYSGFTEVELAALNDIGYNIDLRNFFGRSVYTDGNTLVNNTGYFARNAAGTSYVQNQENLASYGLGLHIFGNNNDVTQAADILANGVGGGGIRSDGFNNTIRIAPNVRVHANGELGTGLLVAYGTGTTVVHRGDLQATGTNGIAARFDFGQNALGDLGSAPYENHWSYKAGYGLDGALVDQFDVTGSISGTDAAIYIADNAHVAEINLLRGAKITGNIVSGYQALDNNGVMRGTTLTFGKANVNGVAVQNSGDASFNFVYAGNIRGGGDIYGNRWNEGAFDLQTWGGKTSLSGQNSFRSGNVGQGTISSELNINGRSDFGNASILANGVLSGTGIIGTETALVHRGLISPGNNGIGTLTLQGNLNSTGDFRIELDGKNYPKAPVAGVNNDLFAITDNTFTAVKEGAATINGGTVHAVADQKERYVSGKRYTFLTTTNGLTVTNPLTSDDNIAVFDFLTGHDANNYWLDVTREYLYGAYGDTFNQRSVGKYIDIIGSDPVPGSDFYTVLTRLDTLNGGIAHRAGISRAAKFALDQMSGAVYGTHATSSIFNVGVVNNTLADVLRSGSWNSKRNCNPCDQVDCEPCEPCEPCEKACEPVNTQKSFKRHLWGLGYGTGGHTQYDGNAYGYDQSFGGTIVGVGGEYKRGLHVGGFFSYGEGRISSDLIERSKSKELLGGIYLRKKLFIGYALASAGLGNTQYDTERTISFVNRKANSKHDAFVGTVYAERGLDFKTESGRLQPFFGLQYIGNRQDAFTETGAGSLNLVAGRTNTDSFRSLLGTRLSSDPRKVEGGKLTVFGNAVWQHEFLRQTYGDFTAQFSNPGFSNFSSATTFTVHGNDPKRDWAVLGAGLNYDKNQLRLFGGYDAYVNKQQILHTGNAGLAYGW